MLVYASTTCFAITTITHASQQKQLGQSANRCLQFVTFQDMTHFQNYSNRRDSQPIFEFESTKICISRGDYCGRLQGRVHAQNGEDMYS